MSTVATPKARVTLVTETPRTVLYFATEDWFFVSHFLDRAVAALRAGYEILVLTHVDCYGSVSEQAGFTVVSLNLGAKAAIPSANGGLCGPSIGCIGTSGRILCTMSP